ncbi:MAG: universal stress protein [Candidatus Obscuribacterales bacterium]|jgi:nucleotide-binding universal stress UspA family protein
MKPCSFLLPINGSPEALFASEFVWSLASNSRSKVTAQHTIDIFGTLQFLGQEKAGLVGSGPYVAAYENICQSLRAIASKLEDSYSARAASHNVDSTFICADGDPVEEICKLAPGQDLLVVGYRKRVAVDYPACQGIKLSRAERLAHLSPIPILFVQKPIQAITEFAIFVSMDHMNVNWLKNCMHSALALGANYSVTILASGVHEESASAFVRDLVAADDEIEEERIKVVSLTDGGGLLNYSQMQDSVDSGRVVVLPTIDSGDHRITSTGECPTALLRRVAFESILLWPEEFAKPIFNCEGVLLKAGWYD